MRKPNLRLQQWHSGVQKGGPNGAPAPGIQGQGHSKSEITKIEMQ